MAHKGRIDAEKAQRYVEMEKPYLRGTLTASELDEYRRLRQYFGCFEMNTSSVKAFLREQDGKRFERWMEQVDGVVGEVVGVSVYDLPGCCYRDWYDSGISATEAAQWAIEECVS